MLLVEFVSQKFAYTTIGCNHKGGVQIIKMEIWDFFSMKGGGLEFHIPILKNDFFWKPFRIIPWLWKRFALSLGFILCIVVEVTMSMAK